MLHTLSLQLSGSSEKRRPEVTGGIHQEGSRANSHHHPGEWHNRLTQDDGTPRGTNNEVHDTCSQRLLRNKVV